MKPLVSVLIPSFNCRRWIGQAVESALSQTWRPIEIVVVDDGSTDGTHDALLPLRGKGVTIARQARSNASTARNTAFRLCRGDFIQWLDADDVLHPAKIELQLSRLLVGDLHAIASSSWATFMHRLGAAKPVCSPFSEDMPAGDWLLSRFRDAAWMPPVCFLMPRAVVEAAGPWNETLTVDDDGEFMTRAACNSSRVVHVAEAICFYRTGRASSLSRRRDPAAVASLARSVELSVHRMLKAFQGPAAKEACYRYLQTQMLYFYPRHTQGLHTALSLAHTLGYGTSPLPLETPLFRIARTVLGWGPAKTLKMVAAQMTLYAKSAWDSLACSVFGDTPPWDRPT